MNVYFVSGMSASCSAAFDGLELPIEFEKKYIEWFVPKSNQSMDEYVEDMILSIDQSQPYTLVGYSLGGVIVLEMNKKLNPIKTIIIASAKNREEVTPLLQYIEKKRLENNLTTQGVEIDDFTIDIFTQLVYKVTYDAVKEFLSCTDPTYMRWAISQFFEWKPLANYTNLYHIHGTQDQLFPTGHFNTDYVVDGGDHLMINKRTREINTILNEILLQ